MNSTDLFLKLDYLSPSGHTLNVEQRASLQSSLPLLRKNLKLDRVNFWGKVFGTEKDYLIAQGFGRDLFGGGKKSFVSHDGIDWVQLPEIDATTASIADQIRSRFTGDPSVETVVFTGPEPAESEPDKASSDDAAADDDEAKPSDDDNGEEGSGGSGKKAQRPSVTITEEKRLVRLVQLVDHDTSVVPRGAYMFTADNTVVLNTTFQGLSAHEASSLASYAHLRPAEALPRKSLLEREHLSKTLDFLDTINEDIPRGSWSIRRDATTNVVTLRSLKWPGSFAFHVAGTPSFGSAYFGNGQSNVDLGFAL